MKGSLIILFFFCSGVLLARLGLIPTYLLEHDFTVYALWLLMLLVGISIGSDRRLGEILRTLRPRVLLLPLATTVGTFAGTALVSLFLTYSVSECMAVGAGFAYYSLSTSLFRSTRGRSSAPLHLSAIVPASSSPCCLRRCWPVILGRSYPSAAAARLPWIRPCL